MRFVMFAAGLTLVLTSPFEVRAQADTSTPASTLGTSRQAPLGHRQPTADSVEKARAQKGNGPKAQQPRNDLDKDLMICRGC